MFLYYGCAGKPEKPLSYRRKTIIGLKSNSLAIILPSFTANVRGGTSKCYLCIFKEGTLVTSLPVGGPSILPPPSSSYPFHPRVTVKQLLDNFDVCQVTHEWTGDTNH